LKKVTGSHYIYENLAEDKILSISS